MYNIAGLREKDQEVKQYFKTEFIEFFRAHDYDNLDGVIKNVTLEGHSDLDEVRRGSGLYLILSDYRIDENPCTLSVNGLKVMYRGHGVRIRKRVESHLFNVRYNQNLDGTTYSVCMKLDDDNGININASPYAGSQWSVIYHPMTSSTKTMREQAEVAFDEVYNMPLASRS